MKSSLYSVKVDAVIGHPPLWKIVGANALAAVAGTDQGSCAWRLPSHAVRVPAPSLMRAASTDKALRLVLVLTAVVLTFNHDPGREMGDAHRRIGFVDVLATGAGSAGRYRCGFLRD